MNIAEREALMLAVKEAILTYCQMQPEDSIEASYYRSEMGVINKEFDTITCLLKKEPHTAIKSAEAIVKCIEDYKGFVLKHRSEKYSKRH